MKLGSILGILMLATAIVYGEWKSTDKEKRARIVSAGITAVAAVLGIILLFQPRLPWSYPVCEAYIWKCG